MTSGPAASGASQPVTLQGRGPASGAAADAAPDGLPAASAPPGAAGGRPRGVLSRGQRLAIECLSVLAGMALWEILGVTKAVDPLTLPSFTGTVQQLWQDVSTGSLNSDFVATGEPFLIGLAISIVVGSVIGVAMGLSRFGETVLTPWVLGFNAVPRIAFIPMTIIAFGLGVTAHSVVVVATAVFPMIINMHAGVRSVDPELLEMSTAFRASRWLNLRRVVIPSTAPFFSSGFRMAIALALIGEVVAEFFSANRGIGYQLNVASQVYNIKQVYAMMIVLAVIGIVLASLARLLERRVERWYGTAR